MVDAIFHVLFSKNFAAGTNLIPQLEVVNPDAVAEMLAATSKAYSIAADGTVTGKSGKVTWEPRPDKALVDTFDAVGHGVGLLCYLAARMSAFPLDPEAPSLTTIMMESYGTVATRSIKKEPLR